MNDLLRSATDMASTLGEYLKDLDAGEIDYVVGYLVDEYPEQAQRLAEEIAFWWPEGDQQFIEGINQCWQEGGNAGNTC